MKQYVCLILSFVIACCTQYATAQIANSQAVGVNGTVTVDGVVYSISNVPRVEQITPSYEPYDLSQVDAVAIGSYGTGSSQVATKWDGGDQPIHLTATSQIDGLDYNVQDTQNHSLFRLYASRISAKLQAQGTCPSAVTFVHSVELSQFKLYFNEQEVDFPANPEPNTVVPIATDNTTGMATYYALQEKGTAASVVALTVQATVTTKEHTVDVDLALAKAAATLDCLHVPVELQSFTID